MTDKPDDILAAAMRTALRQLEGIPEGVDVPIANIAPYFKSTALRAIADITELSARVLHSIDPGPPIEAPRLVAMCSDIERNAANIASPFALMLFALGKDSAATREKVLQAAADDIHELAVAAMQVAQAADTKTPVDVEGIVALLGAMRVLAKHLRAALTTTPTPTSEASP